MIYRAERLACGCGKIPVGDQGTRTTNPMGNSWSPLFRLGGFHKDNTDPIGRVVELVDTADLKSASVIRSAGSSPAAATNNFNGLW